MTITKSACCKHCGMRLESVWEMGVEFMSRDSFIREVTESRGDQVHWASLEGLQVPSLPEQGTGQ